MNSLRLRVTDCIHAPARWRRTQGSESAEIFRNGQTAGNLGAMNVYCSGSMVEAGSPFSHAMREEAGTTGQSPSLCQVELPCRRRPGPLEHGYEGCRYYETRLS